MNLSAREVALSHPGGWGGGRSTEEEEGGGGVRGLRAANPNQKTDHVNYYILRQIILPSDLGLTRAKSSRVFSPGQERRTCACARRREATGGAEGGGGGGFKRERS